MGCDGGTIPRRDELVRVKKKPEAVCLNRVNMYKSNIKLYFRKTRIQN
jgi:hypothetical protein